MIIKSHIRGGYRAAAEYLKAQGLNEKIRLVEISDPEAKNLDEAFHNMWIVANCTRATKPLHHISINPMKDERLTDKQVLAIVERCEQTYGYKMFQHQRVIVEHVRDGRQHFHVIWNRVNSHTTQTIWPGQHWKKSKQICREMEKELGLKTPVPRRKNRSMGRSKIKQTKKKQGAKPIRKLTPKAYLLRKLAQPKPKPNLPPPILRTVTGKRTSRPSALPLPIPKPKTFYPIHRHQRKKDENIPDSEKLPFRRPEWEIAELIAWAWETGNYAVLASLGIYVHPDTFEP